MSTTRLEVVQSSMTLTDPTLNVTQTFTKPAGLFRDGAGTSDCPTGAGL